MTTVFGEKYSQIAGMIMTPGLAEPPSQVGIFGKAQRALVAIGLGIDGGDCVEFL